MRIFTDNGVTTGKNGRSAVNRRLTPEVLGVTVLKKDTVLIKGEKKLGASVREQGRRTGVCQACVLFRLRT